MCIRANRKIIITLWLYTFIMATINVSEKAYKAILAKKRAMEEAQQKVVPTSYALDALLGIE